MKKWLIRKIFGSKKFWYALGGIVIPIIATKLGVPEDTVEKIWMTIVGLLLAQGAADIGVYMNKKSD